MPLRIESAEGRSFTSGDVRRGRADDRARRELRTDNDPSAAQGYSAPDISRPIFCQVGRGPQLLLRVDTESRVGVYVDLA